MFAFRILIIIDKLVKI